MLARQTLSWLCFEATVQKFLKKPCECFLKPTKLVVVVNTQLQSMPVGARACVWPDDFFKAQCVYKCISGFYVTACTQHCSMIFFKDGGGGGHIIHVRAVSTSCTWQVCV